MPGYQLKVYRRSPGCPAVCERSMVIEAADADHAWAQCQARTGGLDASGFAVLLDEDGKQLATFEADEPE